ncbi:MAG: hypothetical protein ABGY32_05560 [bacterium]
MNKHTSSSGTQAGASGEHLEQALLLERHPQDLLNGDPNHP